jgi:hypothetical protein
MVGVVGIDLLGLALSCKLGGQAGLKLLVTEGVVQQLELVVALEAQDRLVGLRRGLPREDDA